jgi:hypothetical protein
MSIPDDSFHEQYKPLPIPAHYDFNDPEQDRVLFALANIGKGTVIEVVNEMAILEPGTPVEDFIDAAASVLNNLYQKGLLKGVEVDGDMEYNLSKITEANDGAVDPDLLAPGLD